MWIDLVNICLDNPKDSLARLALADYLEEQNDPRSELIRLIPTLLALPQRVVIRADVPIEMPDPVPTHRVPTYQFWDWSEYFREIEYSDVKGLWLELRIPKLDKKFPSHNLGRLFLCALIREMVLPIIPDLLPWLNRYELFNCKLIDHKVRDAHYPTISGPEQLCYYLEKLNAFEMKAVQPYCACRAIWRCRSSRFGCYVCSILDIIRYPIHKVLNSRLVMDWSKDNHYLQAEAEFYGRVLDLHEKFVEICPWEAAKEITRKAKIVRRIEWERQTSENKLITI